MRKATKLGMILLFSLTLFERTSSSQERESPRIRQNFNSSWMFHRQANGTGELGSFDREIGRAGEIEPRVRDASRPDYDDSWWQRLDLPHTWNAHDVSDEKAGYWRGIGWYRKHFKLDRRYSGKRVFLEFEGVNHVAEFWLNGTELGGHKGGYTGFEFEISNHAKFGEEENVLTVKVDNLYHATVPPTVKTDYCFYGGIYRDVWLRVSEPTYIASVYWTTPYVSPDSATLQLNTTIANMTGQPWSLTLVEEVYDPQNQLVRRTTSDLILRPGKKEAINRSDWAVKSPHLWAPESPSLYRIKTSLHDGTHVLDSIESPLGFRWFKFDPQKGFYLNGKRVQIQGTNWHQSYPGMGNALPNSRHVRDMEMIHDMGVNFWRTSHYPHDPATMEASDRLGLMVWEELPINKEIGDPDEYIKNVSRMAVEMIERDRNHPSVILWGIAGEVNAPKKVSKQVVEVISRKYRELDPTRPVAMHSPRGEEIEALVDVVGLGVDKETDEKHRKYPGRCFMTAEYSASTMGRGIYGLGPESEDLACQKHEEYLSQLNLRPWMAGGMIWEQFDYEGETYDTVIPHVVAFGMTDMWRIPKEVYYFYQSQWRAQLMAHIVGHWTWPDEEGKTKSVKVYSNADEVELFLNGKSLGTQTASSSSGLEHSPRIWQVPYQSGTLKAVGHSRGKEVVHEIRTAGRAHHILLESDVQRLEAGDPESLAYLTASVVDRDGTVVPDSHQVVTFTSYGPGELLKQTWLGHGTGLTWNAVAGQTRVAFRATSRTGQTVISAYSPGLLMGRIELEISKPGTPNEMEYKEKFEVDEMP
jgi:beta-galactosidase